MNARQAEAELKKLRAENTKLKAENARLKKKPPATVSKKTSRQPLNIVRRIGVILLVCFAVALLTVANLLFWFGNTVVKQDRFVAATQPIIKDPEVQKAMALYTTNSIFNNIDVQQATENVLPPRADFLAPQLTQQLKTFTQATLQKALAKPALQDRWNKTTARQHERLINFARNYQGNGDISVNDVFNRLTANLSDTKLAFLADKQLPAKVGDVTVVSAPWLPPFHDLVVNIDTWRVLALILLVVCVAAAVWLSRRRRRTIYIFSLASAAMTLATLIALHFVRDAVIGKVDPQYAEAVRHIIKIVFHSLVIQTVTILLIALFISLIAWISGPSRRAMAVKRQTALLTSGKMHSQIFSQENKYTGWVLRNKRLVQWAAVAIVSVIMLLVRLTPLALILYALLLAVLVIIIEIIAGQEAEA
jgi:hypothetical protein